MDKRALTEAEICDRFITPALVAAGWDQGTQISRDPLRLSVIFLTF